MKILVIGGGVIGSSLAWRLATGGADVQVFERGRVGGEASGAAAGMIAPQAEAHDPGPFFDLCMLARNRFDAMAEQLRTDSGIDPEYENSAVLYAAFGDQERAQLEQRAQWQREAGATVEELSREQALQREPALSPEVSYALYLPSNGRVDNRRLTQAYMAAALRRGAAYREGAQVEAIATRSGRAVGVRLHDGSVHEGDLVVNCAGAWAGSIRGLEADGVQIRPVRGQIVCFRARPGVIGPALFSAHGYVVPRRDGRLLAGSTMEDAGYDRGVTLAGMARIVAGASLLLPSLGAATFDSAWAGLRPATSDLLPVIGPSPSLANVLYAAGHFRSGILLSALTGELVAEIAAGSKPSLDLAPFSPARFSSTPPQVNRPGVLALVRDLLFRSRIDAAAQAVGIEVTYASTLEAAGKRCAEMKPAAIVADLSDAAFPTEDVASRMRSVAPAARLVGFASHVDLKILSKAREAGFDLTLSRSEFTARLPNLLRDSGPAAAT